MILVFYFVVGSHFGFLRLLFCSEFGGTLLDGFVFCREPFSTKSPVSTSAPNGQGDLKSLSYEESHSHIFAPRDSYQLSRSKRVEPRMSPQQNL